MLKSSLLRLRHFPLAVAAPVVLLSILVSLPQVASADPTVGPSTTPAVGTTSPGQVEPTPTPAGTPSVDPNPSTAGTPTAVPTRVPTKTPMAARAAGDEPVRPPASTAISGVLRNAE